jgi:hypothetical protein
MMSFVAHALVPAGVLFPASTVQSATFSVLAALVAINTVMYGALAVAKMLPKVYPSNWVSGRSRRSQSRSIHPDTADDGPTSGR